MTIECEQSVLPENSVKSDSLPRTKIDLEMELEERGLTLSERRFVLHAVSNKYDWNRSSDIGSPA